MSKKPPHPSTDEELREWLDSLDYVIDHSEPERVQELLRQLQVHAYQRGIRTPFTANTPYINTLKEDAIYPGNRDLEKRIRSYIRWNAMAMVVRANRKESGLGGHISTFASAATLYEVGFNHFFRSRAENFEGDLIYFQGHAAPGIYARAFLEGRLNEKDLDHFRMELAAPKSKARGLPSYPHPRLMPDFWQFPTVSMGLGPIMSIYQARFMRYLEDRGLKNKTDAKVWAFLGDGETDEPETLGAITLASREHLDNLIFVINCNLQRLDGPVRGNGKIIQELEAVFRGAGWKVFKVIWGHDWDPLLEKDTDGLLIRRMNEAVDGEYQKYIVESGAYIREHFFGRYPELLKLVENYTDDQLRKLNRGGHDIRKVFAAYKAAMQHRGSPVVILAKTIKGYGLGEAGEGKNITHQQKKLNEDELKYFRTRFGIPVSDTEIQDTPFYKPADDAPEMEYMRARRTALGGSVPQRTENFPKLKLPEQKMYEEFFAGTGEREVSTTMAFVRILTKLLQDEKIGKYIVPIVPDEARTFGMESLFRSHGIYSHIGQLYEPVDRDSLLYYKESATGQILEEGITEAGSMSSFIAAGTAYSTYGIPIMPFFIYYSMFGLQRVGDLIWAASDMRCKGFLLGGTAGRTTLNGEGLQHEDGHSHLLAHPIPHLKAYDPAFAYEVAVIVSDGLEKMYVKNTDDFYYITLQNENYTHPPMPAGCEEGIIKGLYLFSENQKHKMKIDILGSGSILNEVLAAAKILDEEFQISAAVWSVTSYKELYNDARSCDRYNRLHPEKEPQIPYVMEKLSRRSEAFVAVSDYVSTLPNSIAQWIPGKLITLGTDGFGRSDTRENLREHFEVNHNHIVIASLTALSKMGLVKSEKIQKAIKKLGIDTDKIDALEV